MPATARWTRSPISPSATPSTRSASAMSRTWSCRMSRAPTCKAVYDALARDRLGDGQCRPHHRHHRLPRASTIARSPMRARSPSRRTSRARFASLERQREIGELKIKISGCINACGHHHVGHIGILGVEKKGDELYQITLGGSGDEHASIGEIIGRGFGPRRDHRRRRDASSRPISALRAQPRRELPRRLSPARRSAVQGGALWRAESKAA